MLLDLACCTAVLGGNFTFGVIIRPVALLKERRHLPVVRLQQLYCIHLKTPCDTGRR